jgi:hypothetical protein
VNLLPVLRAQPGLDVRVFVGGVVVHDHVHVQAGGDFCVDDLEELAVAVLGQA